LRFYLNRTEIDALGIYFLPLSPWENTGPLGNLSPISAPPVASTFELVERRKSALLDRLKEEAGGRNPEVVDAA
jgi:hypothetical protein